MKEELVTIPLSHSQGMRRVLLSVPKGKLLFGMLQILMTSGRDCSLGSKTSNVLPFPPMASHLPVVN